MNRRYSNNHDQQQLQLGRDDNHSSTGIHDNHGDADSHSKTDSNNKIMLLHGNDDDHGRGVDHPDDLVSHSKHKRRKLPKLCKAGHTTDDHDKQAKNLISALARYQLLPIPTSKKLELFIRIKMGLRHGCGSTDHLVEVIEAFINAQKSDKQIFSYQTITEIECAFNDAIRAVKKLPIRVYQKLKILKSIRRELPAGCESHRYIQPRLNKYEIRFHYIKQISDCIDLENTYFLTLRAGDWYTDTESKSAMDRILRHVNRKIFGRKEHLYLTGLAMFEKHNRHGNETLPHFHCLLTPPAGYEDRVDEDIIQKHVNYMVEPYVRIEEVVEEVVEGGVVVEVAVEIEVEDVRTHGSDNEDPMFVSVKFEPITDKRELADYLTKNLMNREVINSDETGAGLYELGRNRMTKIS